MLSSNTFPAFGLYVNKRLFVSISAVLLSSALVHAQVIKSVRGIENLVKEREMTTQRELAPFWCSNLGTIVAYQLDGNNCLHVDVNSAAGTCQAQVTYYQPFQQLLTRPCACSVCDSGFGESPVSIDCSGTVGDYGVGEGNVLPECSGIDCNDFSCNGNCIGNCEQSGSLCPLCPAPKESKSFVCLSHHDAAKQVCY